MHSDTVLLVVGVEEVWVLSQALNGVTGGGIHTVGLVVVFEVVQVVEVYS